MVFSLIYASIALHCAVRLRLHPCPRVPIFCSEGREKRIALRGGRRTLPRVRSVLSYPPESFLHGRRRVHRPDLFEIPDASLTALAAPSGVRVHPGLWFDR